MKKMTYLIHHEYTPDEARGAARALAHLARTLTVSARAADAGLGLAATPGEVYTAVAAYADQLVAEFTDVS